MTILSCIEKYIDSNASHIKLFWANGNETDWDIKTLQDHADYIYIRTLLGQENWFRIESAEKYADIISNLPLAGRQGCVDRLLPHLTAYLLSSLNLLSMQGADFRSTVLSKVKLDLNSMIHSESKLPKWPVKWSHHTWRVSHWIGGIPSILLTFARHDPNKQIDESLVYDVLQSCDKLILNPKNGLMKAYKSEILQQLFRQLYRLRHNPEHGDIGGLVHVHWVNHVLNRPYIAPKSLVNTCMEHLRKKPFLEKVPYCLDFDYIQLVRTTIQQNPFLFSESIKKRIDDFKSDLLLFLSDMPTQGYSLHKLPGALAALHETCLILGCDVPELNIKSIDIIKEAYWL